MALTHRGKATRRTDGKAIDVVVPSGMVVDAGDPVYIDGWHGIAMANGDEGDIIAIEVEPSVHEIELGSAVAAAKGAVLYITTDGTNDVNATNTNRLFGKVVKAKDANNIVWVRIAENR